jgi:uncharacterized protein DUF4350
LRRGEVSLVAASLGILIVAAILGVRGATPMLPEEGPLSTREPGPGGAKGLATVLENLGVAVTRWQRPLFDFASDTVRIDPRRVLAFLDITWPTPEELEALRGYVARGGRVFVAGSTGIERCFGYELQSPGWRHRYLDSVAVATPDPTWRVPEAREVFAPLRASAAGARRQRDDARACPILVPDARDTLLRALDRRVPVALRLGFRGGGEAVLLADARYLRNRALKETDAGLLVLGWFADGRTRVVTVDEYHQGYGSKTSMFGLFAASWQWLTGNPAGWALLQLAAVLLIGLAVSAARFGPARAVIERRRRSPLEHLEALAAGLEGAAGVDTAVALAVSGLRRRLGRSGIMPAEVQHSWLAALELALPTPAGRRAVRRLQDLVSRPGGPERALAAAQAVEDVWEELRPPQSHAAS